MQRQTRGILQDELMEVEFIAISLCLSLGLCGVSLVLDQFCV